MDTRASGDVRPGRCRARSRTSLRRRLLAFERSWSATSSIATWSTPTSSQAALPGRRAAGGVCASGASTVLPWSAQPAVPSADHRHSCEFAARMACARWHLHSRISSAHGLPMPRRARRLPGHAGAAVVGWFPDRVRACASLPTRTGYSLLLTAARVSSRPRPWPMQTDRYKNGSFLDRWLVPSPSRADRVQEGSHLMSHKQISAH
jgi:hypothetical protein